METITATLKKLIYVNDDTNFVIGIFSRGREEITALGEIENPEVRQEYALVGEWKSNPNYGQQFAFMHCEAKVEEIGTFKYIVRQAKFVGPTIAKAIIEMYGEGTMDMLRNEPEQVAADIKGITLERAREISGKLSEFKNIEQMLIYLESLFNGFKIRKSIPMELIKKHKQDTISTIKSNPYRTLMDCKGIGFLTCDAIATKKLEIEPQSIFRQQAAILHVLDTNERNGNTWMPVDIMLTQCFELLKYTPQAGFLALIEEKEVRQIGNLAAQETTARHEETIAMILFERTAWN